MRSLGLRHVMYKVQPHHIPLMVTVCQKGWATDIVLVLWLAPRITGDHKLCGLQGPPLMSVLAEQLGGDWNAEGMSESSPTLFVHHLHISQAACKGSKTCGMQRQQHSCLAPATPATPAQLENATSYISTSHTSKTARQLSSANRCCSSLCWCSWCSWCLCTYSHFSRR